MEPGIPVNPAIIKWARLRAGYSIYALTKTFPHWDSWEKGKRMPSAAQLDRLAAMLKVPAVIFFFPRPPQEPALESELEANDVEHIDNINPIGRLLYRKAKAYQIYLRDLFAANNTKPYQKLDWIRKANKASAKMAAKQIRDHFGIDVATQLKWRNADMALEKWREVFVQQGVFVFKEAFKNEKIAGFCLYDENYPLIFLNNSQPKTQQIFTLFHQLGHLIRRENYLDILTLGTFYSEAQLSKGDVFCNTFAGHFLIPESMTEKLQLLDLPETMVKSAALYKVGTDVLARRALEIKRISPQEYKKTMLEFKRNYEEAKTKVKRKHGGNYYSTHLSYIGKDYCGLVMNSYYQGKINAAKAAEYLDIKPKSFGGIENAFLRKGSK